MPKIYENLHLLRMRSCYTYFDSFDWSHFRYLQCECGCHSMEIVIQFGTPFRYAINFWLVCELVFSKHCQCFICADRGVDSDTFCVLLLLHYCHLQTLWSVDCIILLWRQTYWKLSERFSGCSKIVTRSKGKIWTRNWSACPDLWVIFFLNFY